MSIRLIMITALVLCGGIFSAFAEEPSVFPYGSIPETKPDVPLSKAMQRVYDGPYTGIDNARNELFTNFKYTPLKGFDYHGHDGTVSRRDATKVIRANGKYYVWYTHRQTPTPPNYDGGANETIPSRDWDLSEIWYATSDDGFTWEEQGVAVKRMKKPHAGWRSVSTPDILVWKGKYYLYYQAYLLMPGSRLSSATNGDDCPVSVSESDSPDGPWIPSNKIVVENGPPGSWDQYVIHDPYPLVYNGQIYLYYKGEMGGDPAVRAQGLAIADHPLGPFKKHPQNPVINSGHETSLFPFKTGIAALVSRHGLEHNTIQYSPDGVNFDVAAITGLMPIAPAAYVADAFTDTRDGRGITWGICHFRNLKRDEGKSHSMLARFDCDLSLDVNDVEMKETDIFNDPDIYFKFKLSETQRERIQNTVPQKSH
ncbi:Glycosyl hydrolases family 43 [Neorhodopirellula lusitana]|uniref:Glycosyl hydrolases family 43 n=1 Tax=Neorhodopirellula lusitana TaxID=445327 RepID=A0ABY1Q9G9_9BACT|nr:glycoside hydrolase [Neorhodopirellula lusitana]SMP63582.1 Glycosyl hydrolases family 43 [Neorhodopirellula lusitana]